MWATDQTAALDWAVAAAAHPGQSASGDAHVVRQAPDGVLVAVVDGLGHGEEAAVAANRAATVLSRVSNDSVISLVRRCHAALADTRGVVMTLAWFSALDDTVSWLGVGNVEGLLYRSDSRAVPRTEHTLVRGGIVGVQLPPLQATVTALAPGDLVILTTDGIRPEFSERIKSGRTPRQIADKILAEYGKPTDDALVFVGRYTGKEAARS